MKSKRAQMEARKALEEGRAKEKAAKALEEEQKKRELEAIAAESERRFKETRMRWEARTCVHLSFVACISILQDR